MTDRPALPTTPDEGADGGFEAELAAWLAARGRPTADELALVRGSVATLPAHGRVIALGRHRLGLIAATAAIVALVGGVALIGRPGTPTGLAASAGAPATSIGPDAALTDPAAWSADPRFASCAGSYVAEPATVFEMTHAQWFPLYFPGWWKGAPELEVDDPALVVIGREQHWPTVAGPPPPGQTYPPDSDLGYEMCIAVGPASRFVTHGYGVTRFARIVPVLSDADIARAAHLDPEVLGDPASWPFPERLGPCSGVTGNELYIFEANPLRDFARYFPSAAPVPDLAIDDPGIVVVYRDPLALRRPLGWTPDPDKHDVCVVFELGAPRSVTVPDVDLRGFHLRIDGLAPSAAPAASAGGPADRSPNPGPPTVTPAPGPAWAGDARSVLQCDGQPLDLGAEASPNPNEVQGDTPEQAVRVVERRAWALRLDVPFNGFTASTVDGPARLFVHLVGARPRVAIAVTTWDGGPVGPWYASSVASCGDDELDPTTPTGAQPFGRWSDAAGSPVAPTVLAATPDCYDGTQVTFRSRLYVRSPEGGVDPSQLEGAWAAGVRLPTTALDTGFRSGPLRLLIAADGTALYVADGDRAERLPHVLGDEVQRTDCN